MIMRLIFCLFSIVVLTGCEPEPQPIRYGEDMGAHCRMTVSDDRYGAELLTTTGKAYMFDSVECLAGYVLAHPEIKAETHSLWVTSFDDPGTLIQLDDAFFLHTPALRSPMGMNLTAFGSETTEDAMLDVYGGEVLTWGDVLALVENSHWSIVNGKNPMTNDGEQSKPNDQ